MYKSMDSEEKVLHCRCCGARLPAGRTEYCNGQCKSRGMKLWRAEQVRRRKWLTDPIGVTLKRIDTYNKEHGTDYSYGQFVSLVLPRLIKKGEVR